MQRYEVLARRREHSSRQFGESSLLDRPPHRVQKDPRGLLARRVKPIASRVRGARQARGGVRETTGGAFAFLAALPASRPRDDRPRAVAGEMSRGDRQLARTQLGAHKMKPQLAARRREAVHRTDGQQLTNELGHGRVHFFLF